MAKIPANHITWTHLCDKDGHVCQIVTSDAMRQKYFLWEVSADGYAKIETNDVPIFKKDMFRGDNTK